MVLENNYKPTAKAQVFHGSDAFFIVLVGGMGCMREDSLVETIHGLRAMGDILAPTFYQSWNGTSFQLSLGTAPYPKGKGDLYRIVHERGEFVATGHHRIFCADNRYRPVSEASEHSLFHHDLIDSFSQLETENEAFRLSFRSSVHRSTQRFVNFLDYYLADIHRCDQPPRLLSICDQAFSPLLNDARESLLSREIGYLRESLDALLARELANIHHPAKSGRHSIDGLVTQALSLLFALEGHSATLAVEHTSLANQDAALSLAKSSIAKIAHVFSLLEQAVLVPFVSSEKTVSHSAIKSIEKIGFDWFWDIQVGDTNNYVSGGAVHHNSGKSRMAIQEIEQSATQWSGMPIGVYRKTLPALRDSTLAEWRSHSTSEIWNFRERDVQAVCANGSFVNFRGLDEATKVKSTEYALLVLEEADEFTFEDFMFLKGRVRKKGPWPLRIVLLLNPVDDDHWIYKEFVKNAQVYQEAGGLLVLHLSSYDNAENLPAGYIEQNTAGMTADEIDRYVHGHWGTIVKGEPVYAKHLNSDLHLEHWDYVRGIHRLVRGWDFGFNHPACSLRLVDPSGRANCHTSLMGEKIDLDVFALQVLEHTERNYPGLVDIKDFGDPRGHDKAVASKSTQSSTAFQILQDVGVYAIGERGSREYVEPGIKAVRNEFTQLVQGKPKLTIDPRNSLLRAAYFGKYVRDETGAPKKDGFYEHVSDADRYISHHTKSDSAVKKATAMNQAKRASAFARRTVTGYRVGGMNG